MSDDPLAFALAEGWHIQHVPCVNDETGRRMSFDLTVPAHLTALRQRGGWRVLSEDDECWREMVEWAGKKKDSQ